jgi:glucosyl-dolichyl phosphate glucuronosyltransferase
MYISVIIPTRNRSRTLRVTLNSLLNQNDLKDLEVIIIDNGSTDDTKQICDPFINDSKLKFKYYYDDEPGLLTGRHLGASLAKGDVIGFLDDDVELAPTWVAGIKDAFINSKIHLATGPCLPRHEIEPPAWLQYFWSKIRGKGLACDWLSLIDLGNKKRFIDPNLVWGLNFCIRKDALFALGGFHPDNIPANLQMYQGDGETGLTMKARSEGYKALYHPEIKLFHLIAAERLTIVYFQKRAFYQGVCNSYTHLRKKHLGFTEKDKLTTKDKVKWLLKPVKSLIVEMNKLRTPKEIVNLKELLLKYEKAGFNFHQNAFKENPNLQNWVLKKDYWDYKLPL